jgi:salicylate hydroxylase
MYQLALQLGIAVKINFRVVDYDEDAPSIMLENGESHSADLIIASDGEWVELQHPPNTVRQLTAKGVKSYARTKVLGGVDQAPRKTGFAAYRATVDVEKMKAYPDTAEVCDKPNLNLWLVLCSEST